jgi:hypothetical protein
VLGAVVAFVVVLCVVAYFFRDALATRVAAHVLDGRPGLRCTHPDVRISRALDSVTLTPIKCSLSEGPITKFSAESNTVVLLDGLHLRSVNIPRATIDQRDRDMTNVESNALGDLAQVIGMRDSLCKGLLDASEMYSDSDMLLQVGVMTQKRKGKTESVMHGFRRTFEKGWDRQFAERVESSPELASVRNFDMRVTPSRGELTADIYLGKPKHGEKPDAELKIDGRELDQKKPRFKLSL